MEFNNKEVYLKMYGSFRCVKDTADFMAEQAMTYYYIASKYSADELFDYLVEQAISCEHDAMDKMSILMHEWNTEFTIEQFDKRLVAKGRRIFDLACSRLKTVHEPTFTDLVMEAYPEVNKFYILYDNDVIRWVYVDDAVDSSRKNLPLSRFPDGYKDILQDKLTVVEREVVEYV